MQNPIPGSFQLSESISKSIADGKLNDYHLEGLAHAAINALDKMNLWSILHKVIERVHGPVYRKVRRKDIAVVRCDRNIWFEPTYKGAYGQMDRDYVYDSKSMRAFKQKLIEKGYVLKAMNRSVSLELTFDTAEGPTKWGEHDEIKIEIRDTQFADFWAGKIVQMGFRGTVQVYRDALEITRTTETGVQQRAHIEIPKVLLQTLIRKAMRKAFIERHSKSNFWLDKRHERFFRPKLNLQWSDEARAIFKANKHRAGTSKDARKDTLAMCLQRVLSGWARAYGTDANHPVRISITSLENAGFRRGLFLCAMNEATGRAYEVLGIDWMPEHVTVDGNDTLHPENGYYYPHQ